MSFQDAVLELDRYKNELAQMELKLLQVETRKGILDKRGLDLESKLEKASEEEQNLVRGIQAQKDKIETLNSAAKSKKEYLK